MANGRREENSNSGMNFYQDTSYRMHAPRTEGVWGQSDLVNYGKNFMTRNLYVYYSHYDSETDLKRHISTIPNCVSKVRDGNTLFPVAQQPPVGQGFLIIGVHDHTQTHHSR
jgi:hypothetical protein